ncbi:hypothetical protein UFOVP100_6 [uncultured Caudovirales phage]|uniref:Uncharacterized protein n=1 Tax=uncultured Caudovirales phage TaxID=2100421 RepID=A0A6J5KZY0_9CAUD|nr:hypothetical protein UFOVP100_6 [uncultured Caudovirales phage]
MAGIKITDLPAAASALLTDVYPVDQLPGPVTYKESNAQLFSLFQSNGSALTETNDTNVTLTLAGSASTALLNPASITAGWTGTLSPTRGGTGVNNGSNTLTLGGNLTTTGAFTSNFNITGTTNVTFPTSGTLATTSSSVITIDADSGSATPSAGVITISGGSTGLTTSGSGSTVNLGGTLKLTNGGTNASLTASNGGIFYSTASAGAILSGTSTATQMLQSGASTTPAWSTSTWPATTTINQLLYSSSANTVAGLATATTAVLTTSSSVPTWASQLSMALGGTNANLTASNGGIFYSTASAGAILAGTSTAGQLLTSGASTTPVWTTSTYPATNAANTLLYASSANTMAALATANSSVLVTSSGGAPSLSTTLPSGISATNMNLTTPTLGVATATSINFGGTSLANYLEGTWTPIDASGASLTFTSVTANYTRIGRMVIASCSLTYPSTVNGTNALIGGLPLAANASAGSQGGNVVYTTVATLTHCLSQAGSTTFSLNTAAGGNVTNTGMSLSVNYFQIIYFV